MSSTLTTYLNSFYHRSLLPIGIPSISDAASTLPLQHERHETVSLRSSVVEYRSRPEFSECDPKPEAYIAQTSAPERPQVISAQLRCFYVAMKLVISLLSAFIFATFLNTGSYALPTVGKSCL